MTDTKRCRTSRTTNFSKRTRRRTPSQPRDHACGLLLLSSSRSRASPRTSFTAAGRHRRRPFWRPRRKNRPSQSVRSVGRQNQLRCHRLMKATRSCATWCVRSRRTRLCWPGSRPTASFAISPSSSRTWPKGPHRPGTFASCARRRPSVSLNVMASSFIDSRSYERYDRLAAAAASIDPAGASSLYGTLKPRIEEAAAQLGLSGDSFDRALERAIVGTAPDAKGRWFGARRAERHWIRVCRPESRKADRRTEATRANGAWQYPGDPVGPA